MKTQLKRRFLILLASILILVGFSVLLNRASFDPDFSVVDVIAGASKHSRRQSSDSDTVTEWGYTIDDLVLADSSVYTEEIIDTENGSYDLLVKTDLPEDKLVILEDKSNSDYMVVVQQIAEYYEVAGYNVEIRKCTESMMLSLAHAGHFDLFLLREEAGQ